MPLSATNAFSGLVLDYLQARPELRDFYGHLPTEAGFEAQIEAKKNFPASHRQVLYEVLCKQYEGIADAPMDNIEALREANTFTVTTGHQLCLMTGPAYFVYKIVSTIRLAERLQARYPQYRFVPIYWMATEDHDFAEINHFHLFGQRYEWQREATGAVGRLSTQGLAELLATLPDLPPEYAAPYLESQNLAEATRKLVHTLFKPWGLVCLDGDEAALKRLFAPMMWEDMHQHHANNAVNQSSEALQALGYKAQVYPRKVNFFYLEQGLRERIESQPDGSYQVLNTNLHWSADQLQSLIEQHPERFSPNVVMRPLYQEHILPNLGYIGGPGELAYWLQLKAMFAHYQTPFPILMPRNFATYINKTHSKRLQKLGLSPTALFGEWHQVKQHFLEKEAAVSLALDQEQGLLHQLFDQLVQKGKALDPSLEGWLRAEEQKAQKNLENIKKRFKKTEERKAETSLNQLQTLYDKLFPNGGLQERYDNFLNFCINNPDFLVMLMQQLDPYRMEMYLLQEPN
jgi:bacillithiol biosynthesis cysteine-adding enzyme BshC